ncbi:MAG: ClC family H(+)/Cl(-) exchange transporter [Tissierellia bacterium]|nr:ClC family H(+)/Cl(-) exchange transporter [Tissierellia bacterium]
MDIHDKRSYDLGRNKIELIAYGAVIGLTAGLVSVLYRYVLHKMDVIRDLAFASMTPLRFALWILGALAVSLILHFLLKKAPYTGGGGIPQMRAELEHKIDQNVPWSLISKFFGGGLATLGGLTLGREGPSIQLGGLAAKGVAKLTKRPAVQQRSLITAGCSAGLAAAFNAPLAGVLFALEEMQKSMSHYFMATALVASLVANFVSYSLMGMDPAFAMPMEEMLPMNLIWIPIGVGVVSGIVARIYNWGMILLVERRLKTKIPKYWLIFSAMVLAALVGLYDPSLMGDGHGFVENLAQAPTALHILFIAFILRMILVWTGNGSGVQGGIFMPILALGAIVGVAAFQILGMDQVFIHNFIYLGMAGVLAGSIGAPLLSIILVSEMSGSMEQFISVAVVSMVGYGVAMILKNVPIYESLYELQFADPVALPGTYDMSYFLISGDAPLVGMRLTDVPLPPDAVVTSICRDRMCFTPSPETLLKGGDELLITLPADQLVEVSELFHP